MRVTRFLALLSVLALASCASLPRMTNPFTARTTIGAEAALMEADRAFNDYAQTHGVEAAFVRFADPVDGMLVRPGAVFQGADQIRTALQGAPPNARLIWSPDQAFVARSGEMGMTTGRFVSTLDRQEVDAGRYVSVWRRDEGGSWRILADVGSSDPLRRMPARLAAGYEPPRFAPSQPSSDVLLGGYETVPVDLTPRRQPR